MRASEEPVSVRFAVSFLRLPADASSRFYDEQYDSLCGLTLRCTASTPACVGRHAPTRSRHESGSAALVNKSNV